MQMNDLESDKDGIIEINTTNEFTIYDQDEFSKFCERIFKENTFAFDLNCKVSVKAVRLVVKELQFDKSPDYIRGILINKCPICTDFFFILLFLTLYYL